MRRRILVPILDEIDKGRERHRVDFIDCVAAPRYQAAIDADPIEIG